VNEDTLSTKEISAILYQTASALSFIHQKGFVHRGIKPENIVFSKKDSDFTSLKIVSFVTS